MTKTTIQTEAGYGVSIHTFIPETPGDTIVLILPANGTKQTFYSDFARFLKKKNHTVYTVDYGGIGQSKNGSLRSFDTSITNWGRYDLDAILSAIKTDYPDKKLVVTAHSMGGQIVGLTPSSLQIDKLIFVCVPSGYFGFWHGFEKIKMLMTWYVLFPVLTKLFGYMPTSKISGMEDLPKGVARQWRKWCLSPNYMFEHLDGEDTWNNKIDCPLVSYSVKKDAFAPKEAVDWFTEQYKSCKRKRIHIRPADIGKEYIGHSGFFKESNQDTLWPILLSEIEG